MHHNFEKVKHIFKPHNTSLNHTILKIVRESNSLMFLSGLTLLWKGVHLPLLNSTTPLDLDVSVFIHKIYLFLNECSLIYAIDSIKG